MEFTITRTYETVIEVDTDNYEEALKLLSEVDVYTVELEQCCCIDEIVTDENGHIVKDINFNP